MLDHDIQDYIEKDEFSEIYAGKREPTIIDYCNGYLCENPDKYDIYIDIFKKRNNIAKKNILYTFTKKTIDDFFITCDSMSYNEKYNIINNLVGTFNVNTRKMGKFFELKFYINRLVNFVPIKNKNVLFVKKFLLY